MLRDYQLQSIQDIENILLGEFPEIQNLKCLCHLDKNLEFKPGSILVVTVPQDNKDEISYERYFIWWMFLHMGPGFIFLL